MAIDQTANSRLYEEVVRITHAYFGPAADRFVTRQIRSHLGKAPEELRKQDLKKLVRWISLAMSLLIEDELLVEKYAVALEKLAANGEK